MKTITDSLRAQAASLATTLHLTVDEVLTRLVPGGDIIVASRVANRSRGGSPRRLTVDEDLKIARMYQMDRAIVSDIAAALAVSRVSIYSSLERQGIKLRPKETKQPGRLVAA